MRQAKGNPRQLGTQRTCYVLPFVSPFTERVEPAAYRAAKLAKGNPRQLGTLQLVLMTGMEQQLADHSPNLAVAITATHLQGTRLPAVDMARLPSIFGRLVGSSSEHKQAIPILQPLRHY